VAERIAIIGAGVSGLTCGVLLAERGKDVTILAEEIGHRTTSAAAGAIWFPYDCEPQDKVIAWALQTRKVLVDLAASRNTGVSMIELRQIVGGGEAAIPDWARSLGACAIGDGFSVQVPLTDTTIYLPYLMARFQAAQGKVRAPISLRRLDDVDAVFDLVVNCAGFGARGLTDDRELEPHRGQVALVPRLELDYAVVRDDAPLMYIIPRANDCLFGGTNELSDAREPDRATTAQIVEECSRVLAIDPPSVTEVRVGIRPFRRAGVRLERGSLGDGRPVIHNYGHGGSGFTLSWGCAGEVIALTAS
jgi:D-amino-acid oxidase